MNSSTRRRFLGQSACSAVSSISVMNMLLNLQMAGKAAAQIHRLVVTNFVVGWLAIAAVRLVR